MQLWPHTCDITRHQSGQNIRKNCHKNLHYKHIHHTHEHHVHCMMYCYIPAAPKNWKLMKCTFLDPRVGWGAYTAEPPRLLDIIPILTTDNLKLVPRGCACTNCFRLTRIPISINSKLKLRNWRMDKSIASIMFPNCNKPLNEGTDWLKSWVIGEHPWRQAKVTDSGQPIDTDSARRRAVSLPTFHLFSCVGSC